MHLWLKTAPILQVSTPNQSLAQVRPESSRSSRRGTDSFLGQVNLPGAGRIHFLKSPMALNLMGDWCGPGSDTD